MPNILAMSFEGTLAPSFDLRCLQPGCKPPDGWGLGFYPGGDPAAMVLKEPAPPQQSIRSELVKSWEHLASSLFVLHIRSATWGTNSTANTQPFERAFGGRDWLMAHAGTLRNRLAMGTGVAFEPVGSTDSERVFCELLNRSREAGARTLGDVGVERLHRWMLDLNEHGSLSLLLTDGRDLVAYADRDGEPDMWVCELQPPYGPLRFGDADLGVDLTRRGIKSRKGVLVASERLPFEGKVDATWTRLAPGHLLVVREGAVRTNLDPSTTLGSRPPQPLDVRSQHHVAPAPEHSVRYRVTHRTAYHYEVPVERSTHVLRLAPAHDRTQRVESFELRVSVAGQQREYQDVFGNHVHRLLLSVPYTDLVIESVSIVEACAVAPLRRQSLPAPSRIDHPWMPWQRHMLAPYLLPPELPDSQLEELAEYGESFAARNDYDLLDTLIDLNESIHREYAYRQGTTTVLTTAFDVYTNRRGVCQDFANLFICLARLMNIPARYVCGYIYTGPKAANTAQAEASHAWVEVYLAEQGWIGFDPTNGCLARTEHVRVAVGRSYVDATPTSGTLFVGGGAERLTVSVRVEPL